MLFEIVVILLSVSLDAAAVGMSITVRGERITNMSLVISSVVTAVMLGMVIILSQILDDFIGIGILRIIGAVLLVLIGIKSVVDSRRGTEINFDIDASKVIEGREAVLLGLTLSVDASCAGVTLSNMGWLSVMAVIMAAVLQLLLFRTGVRASGLIKRKHSAIGNMICGRIAGAVLILVGILNILNQD